MFVAFLPTKFSGGKFAVVKIATFHTQKRWKPLEMNEKQIK
jgi:hypothetical protein